MPRSEVDVEAASDILAGLSVAAPMRHSLHREMITVLAETKRLLIEGIEVSDPSRKQEIRKELEVLRERRREIRRLRNQLAPTVEEIAERLNLRIKPLPPR